MKMLSFVAFLVLVISCASSSKRHVIYWDESIESRFIKGEMSLEVNVNEWLDILCPHKTNYDPASFQNDLYLELYNVTKEQYHHCAAHKKQRILRCSDPRHETKLTTKFQKRSPTPLGFVFRPGHTYYYISKPDMNPSRGCGPDTLRLKISVRSEKQHKDEQITIGGTAGVSTKERNNRKTDSDVQQHIRHERQHHIDSDPMPAVEEVVKPRLKAPQASVNPNGNGAIGLTVGCFHDIVRRLATVGLCYAVALLRMAHL